MAERLTPFGKYFLLERINVGGMAEVYKAKTVGVEGFEKLVAIKRILPSVAEDEEFIKMFVDEAKITSQLSHSNLAQTFDLGKIDDTYYIAMEYVPGKDLRAVFERMKRRGDRMPLPLAAFVVSRVCEGLDYAHRKRDAGGRELHIVHRDVSPQNIILSYEGEVKLIDFGIAKAANKITKTQAGILKGKFGYMSPEQVRGLPLDGRSDIFAAGVVLYELCTGERLFTGSSDFSVLEKVQQAKVTPPSQVEPSIPLKLERIILKALAREPEDRYQHAADVAADLTRFLLDSQQKPVTREDVAAFMKGTFPEDERREGDTPIRRPPPRLTEPSTRPAPRLEEPGPPADGRRPVDEAPTPPPERKPPPSRPPRSAPPPLPASLTADLDAEERTATDAPAPEPEPRAEIIVRSKLPPPSSPDLIEPGDSPTRPMSMNELAAAEREFAQREKMAAAAAAASPFPTGEHTPTPKGDPAPEAFAAKDDPTRTPVERPQQPPPARPPRSAPPPLPMTLLEGVEDTAPSGPPKMAPPPPVEEPAPPPQPAQVSQPRASRNGSKSSRPRPRPPDLPAEPVRLEDQKTAVRPAPPRPPPAHVTRMQVNKPTLVGEDPLPHDESTNSTLTRRARWMRRIQIGIVLLALSIALWALLSTPKPRARPGVPGEPVNAGALSVTLQPADAQLLLDGAQVKDSGDPQWSEPRLTAGVEHTLTARRSGYAEQSVPVTLARGEQKALTIKLQAAASQIIVLSSPPGAQVYVDGERKGVTPSYLSTLDPGAGHAITVEKKCYRSWQIAVPPGAGQRQLAASLMPAPGACPGSHLEATGMPAPADLPDEAAASATLGFLNLGSRPSAQVLIDGVDIGQTTPLLAWPLKNGPHQLKLLGSGRSKEVAVEIRTGETHSEIVDLSPAPAKKTPAKKRRGRR
ncbi:MAG: protein kinase domain-containing protein [Myxococcales bacterium]